MDRLSGIVFPQHGDSIFREDWIKEQESKAQEIILRDLDSQGAGLIRGGEVSADGNTKIKIAKLVAYNSLGQRIIIDQEISLDLPAGTIAQGSNKTYLVLARHKFIETEFFAPENAIKAIKHKENAAEVVIVETNQKKESDIELAELVQTTNTLTITDKRIWRRNVQQEKKIESVRQEFLDRVVNLTAYIGVNHVPDSPYPIDSYVRFGNSFFISVQKIDSGEGSFPAQFQNGKWIEVNDTQIGWYVFANTEKNNIHGYTRADGKVFSKEDLESQYPILAIKLKTGKLPTRGSHQGGDKRGFFQFNSHDYNSCTRIIFPNLINLFFRGSGYGNTGVFEHDTMRQIRANWVGRTYRRQNLGSGGAHSYSYEHLRTDDGWNGESNALIMNNFNSARVVATAHENRPYNIRQNILIKIK